jgi:hypothetical protein
MQATVHRLDPAGDAGSVITDTGVVLVFGADVLAASALRHVRTGQRLTVTLDGDPETPGTRVLALHLGTLGHVPPHPSRP